MSKITKITVGGTTYTVGPDSQSYVEASSWSSGSAISCSLSSDGCESVIYKNTGSSSQNDDRGYVAIPK